MYSLKCDQEPSFWENWPKGRFGSNYWGSKIVPTYSFSTFVKMSFFRWCNMLQRVVKWWNSSVDSSPYRAHNASKNNAFWLDDKNLLCFHWWRNLTSSYLMILKGNHSSVLDDLLSGWKGTLKSGRSKVDGEKKITIRPLWSRPKKVKLGTFEIKF